MRNTHMLAGFVYVLISALFMSLLPILGKLSYSLNLGPLESLFLRYLFAFSLLAAYLIIIKRQPVFIFSPLVLAQGIFLIIASILYFLALQYLSAGLTSVIFFTHPVLVAILAIILYKEHFNLQLAGGLIISLTGIILISGIGDHLSISPLGFLLAVLASFFYAIYSLIGQKNMESNDPIRLTANLSFIALIVLSLLNFKAILQFSDFSVAQLFIGLLIGLSSTILAVSFLMQGIKYIGASLATLISSVEPAFTILIAFIVLSEKMSLYEGLGSFLVFVGALLAVSINREPAKKGK